MVLPLSFHLDLLRLDLLLESFLYNDEKEKIYMSFVFEIISAFSLVFLSMCNA